MVLINTCLLYTSSNSPQPKTEPRKIKHPYLWPRSKGWMRALKRTFNLQRLKSQIGMPYLPGFVNFANSKLWIHFPNLSLGYWVGLKIKSLNCCKVILWCFRTTDHSCASILDVYKRQYKMDAMHNTDYIPGLLKYKSDPLFYFAGKADMEQNYPARMQVYFPS